MTDPEKYLWPNGEESELFPETEEILEVLRENPTTEFRCSHGDGDHAVVVCEVPEGCVALPGLETQALCQHHWNSNGSFHGMDAVVDLSIDGSWSRAFDVRPLFTIHRDDDGTFVLTRELTKSP